MSQTLNVLAQFVEAVEVHTAATPPVRVAVSSLGQPGGAPSPLLRLLKPAVVVRSSAGDYTIAPYGAPAPWHTGAALLAGGVALALGGAFVAGYLLGKAAQE